MRLKFFNIFIYPLIFMVVGALIYVYAKGEVSNGIKGWLFLFGYGIQPSEFSKIINILFLAMIYEKLFRKKNLRKIFLFLPLLVPLVCAVLIFVQPDFGTMVILLGIVGLIFCVLPFDKITKIVSFSVGGIAIIIFAFLLLSGKILTPAQKDRLNFKDPCSRYKDRTGYQLCNSYIAINSGGLVGKLPGNSTQKYLYLPEAHTDFIFPIFVEECGFLLSTVLILMYFVLITRILKIGLKAYNLQGTIICYGVAAYIALHILLNLGGVMGLFPLTGVPLPFFSYGGSFMINLLVSLGFVERVAIENVMFEQKHLVS